MGLRMNNKNGQVESSETDFSGRNRPDRYATEPTGMFASDKVVAIYPDGRRVQIFHGLPDVCRRKAERFNEALGRK